MRSGISIPSWIESFADAVALAIQPFDDRIEIGCHSVEIDGVWEVSVFGSRGTEFEDKRAGRNQPLPFVVNVPSIMRLFNQMEECQWQALSWSAEDNSAGDDLGPHLSVRGNYEGQKVWLRILSHPPEWASA